MTVDLKDVIRLHDTAANVTANLKDKMFAWDITNNRFSVKLAGGSMLFISDDTKQVLKAGTQTITGAKTFNQDIKMLAQKLLTLDGIGGLRLDAANRNVFSNNDANYIKNELLSVFGGDLEVADFDNDLGINFIQNGTFASDIKWTKDAEWTIGSGVLSFAHSSGAGSVEQVEADYILDIFAHDLQQYVMTYDITAKAGTPSLVITTDTATTSTAIDLGVGTLKKVFFKYKSGAVKFKMTATSTGGDSFSMDNITIQEAGGIVKARLYGVSGNVEINASGDLLIGGTRKLFLNAAATSFLHHDGSDIILKNIISGDIILNCQTGDHLFQTGGTTRATINGNGLIITSGLDLKLGNTKSGTGDVAVDGFVTIKDSAGATVKLATVA